MQRNGGQTRQTRPLFLSCLVLVDGNGRVFVHSALQLSLLKVYALRGGFVYVFFFLIATCG